MWRCKFCDKTNFDDQTVCPYCTVPNPSAQKPKPANAPQSPAQPQGGVNPPAPDWNARYNPGANAKRNSATKLDAVLKYMVIAASALLIVFLLSSMLKPSARAGGQTDDAPSDQALTAQKDELQGALAKDSPMHAETPEPTRAPVVTDAVADLYLDFGQTYQCSTRDFVLPYDIADDEITWRCSKNEEGSTCGKAGLIRAGTIQVDTEWRYNDAVIVTGTTEEGSVLTYRLYTGDGETYAFDWSTSSRSMRGYLSGYVIVSDKMIVQCRGFSVYYEYELTNGKLEANAWSVWVREDGQTWVRVQDIKMKNKDGKVFDISFDRPITFNEIWIMPETYSSEFGFSSSFYVSYLVFE